jgi:cadmium resistance protein CadD (predicted permease)
MLLAEVWLVWCVFVVFIAMMCYVGKVTDHPIHECLWRFGVIFVTLVSIAHTILILLGVYQ